MRSFKLESPLRCRDDDAVNNLQVLYDADYRTRYFYKGVQKTDGVLNFWTPMLLLQRSLARCCLPNRAEHVAAIDEVIWIIAEELPE